AVFSASKIPITLSPHSIPRAAGRLAHAWPASEETSQSPCQRRRSSYFKHLNENAPVLGPGHICRAGNNCREQSSGKLARGRRRSVELQRITIHAIAQAGRLRTVLE